MMQKYAHTFLKYSNN